MQIDADRVSSVLTNRMHHTHPSADTLISDEFIKHVITLLSQNKRIRRTLPLDGRLSIERQVPFLCVHRFSPEYPDEGTRQLVLGEASYLITPGERIYYRCVSTLVRKIVQTLAERFGGFLIIELWTASASTALASFADLQPHQPAFCIKARLQPNDPLMPIIERLQRSLSKIMISEQQAKVVLETNAAPHPPGSGALIKPSEARAAGCRFIGLEITPIYRDSETGAIYPMLLQSLHRALARTLKQTLFEFVRTHTTHQTPHYHALGRQAMVKAVWHVDRKLAEISDSFDFLLLVTPVNAASAWSAFKRSNFDRQPTFVYRPSPVDPALLKRTLFQIPIERVEDPTLLHLFLEKQRELDQQISMLLDRGTPRFLYGSMSLTGGRDDHLRQVAEDVMQRIRPRSRDDSRSGYLDAQAFARRATEEIAYYHRMYDAFTASVSIRDDVTAGLMVSHGNLLIGQHTKVPANRVDALLHHEIGTHALTYFNGHYQPFRQLYVGLAGYEELQEGLAVLSEYLGGNLSRPRLRLLAARVLGVHCMIDGASFVETFRVLTNRYHIEQYTAFTITMRIYRGGGLTKDMVYLRGLIGVLDYLQRGGELLPLFVGKIASAHVPLIRELQLRRIIHTPPLTPRYMNTPTATARLEYVRRGVSVLDLVERSFP